MRDSVRRLGNVSMAPSSSPARRGGEGGDSWTPCWGDGVRDLPPPHSLGYVRAIRQVTRPSISMISALGLLKERRFLPLFVTQFLGAFNDNFFKTAMVLFATYQIFNDAEVESNFNALATGLSLRSEEHTSELQSLMRPSYAVFCL